MTTLRSLLIVALLAFPLRAETTVMPAAGKLVGVVASDTPGDWGVLASDLSPVVPKCFDGSKDAGWKVCTFEGAAGRYAVIKVPKGGGLEITPVILGGAGPIVTPPVDPNKPPIVNPPVTPAPLAGMRVLILDETSPQFGNDQVKIQRWRKQITALRSLKVRAYLDSKCLPGADGTPGWRKADPSDPQAFRNMPREWQEFRSKLQPTEFQWVAIADGAGNVVSQFPAPTNEDELMAALKQWGG